VSRRIRKTEYKDRMKAGKKEIVIYDKNESKYVDELPIQLSE
jgi:uncharacterized protein YqfB (UPF0267 family)